jgi:hypothetical protein
VKVRSKTNFETKEDTMKNANTSQRMKVNQPADASAFVACSYMVQTFNEEELERAGAILKSVEGLESPQKELEFVRLVLARNGQANFLQ